VGVGSLISRAPFFTPLPSPKPNFILSLLGWQAPKRSTVLLNAGIYLMVCQFQTIAALSISRGGMAAIDALRKSKHGW
jgi:hypothetical protein